MQTHDDWLNAKIAECEQKEQRALARLDKIEARRLSRTRENREEEQIIRISWQTEVMLGPAFDYFHFSCYAEHEFKSEAIANGAKRELPLEQVAVYAICSHCGRKLREQASGQ